MKDIHRNILYFIKIINLMKHVAIVYLLLFLPAFINPIEVTLPHWEDNTIKIKNVGYKNCFITSDQFDISIETNNS
jgi:hypothetical protein